MLRYALTLQMKPITKQRIPQSPSAKPSLALSVATGLLLFATASLAAPDPNFYLFLCFGQSNMESGGRMEEFDRTVDPRFLVMADFDAPNRGWTKANWYQAVPPLTAQGTGICLVDYFGRTMVSNLPPNVRVGVIKVSVPGCKIELFQKDSFTNYVAKAPSWMLNYVKKYGGNPYQYFVDLAKEAQKDGVIKGILLHQGESNPNDHEWPNKVKSIYDNFIKDLDLKPEEVPFLAGETVNADQGGACAGFNKIMAELPKTLANSYVISSAGCTCNPDHMHFNAAGSREFGTRYAEKMLALMGYKVKARAAVQASGESAGVSNPATPGRHTNPGTQRKSFIDYFLPTPPHGALSQNAWGATNVIPRDPQNGLEDPTIQQYCYWDGQILKAPDGKYHMFASRWNESRGHNGWFGSVAVHAVSDSLLGPYVDKGLCWPDDHGGRGHNVGALVLPDGRNAIYISETRPCEIYVSKSLDGPWEHLGTVTVEGEPKWHASNVSLMVRPDGSFEFTERNGSIFTSDKGILGPYIRRGNSVYPKGIPNLEDPCIWYSGGLYHIVVNSWSTRKAYHLTSRDGVSDWIDRGVAYDPREPIVRYPDGTVNHWNKVERPAVYVENGHVAAMTLAAIDVEKEQDKGGDGHGSKVIVIPFDGAALDRDLQSDSRQP